MHELLKWVQGEINEIEADERYHYPRADPRANYILMGIQIDMTARMGVLVKVKEGLAAFEKKKAIDQRVEVATEDTDLELRVQRAIAASDNGGGSASNAIQDMLAILRGDD